jgi:predicted transcriptional regulator of viral defense system
MMEDEQKNIKLSDWVETLQRKGNYSFSLKQIKEDLSSYSEEAIKSSLRRLSKKNKIISIHKGYYLIIPPQYSMRGILPPSLFLDGFMKFLERPYYVGLLNAAAFFGAAHQQPQEYFVVTTFPVLRPTNKKGIKVNYISKKSFDSKLLIDRKTESGYLKVSSPILTAVDLIQFEKRVGGINRVATVLNELVEEIKAENFDSIFFDEVPATTIQRLGYLIEYEIGNITLADKLYISSLDHGIKYFRIPLKASSQTKGFSSLNRWKVIVNIEIEIDE